MGEDVRDEVDEILEFDGHHVGIDCLCYFYRLEPSVVSIMRPGADFADRLNRTLSEKLRGCPRFRPARSARLRRFLHPPCVEMQHPARRMQICYHSRPKTA